MTALDWFVEQLPLRMRNYLQEEIVKAKQMEKEQIIDAFGIGCHHESKRLVGYHHIAEQYYNETYKK